MADYRDDPLRPTYFSPEEWKAHNSGANNASRLNTDVQDYGQEQDNPNVFDSGARDEQGYGADSGDNSASNAIQAERVRLNFNNLLTQQVRDATANFSNLGYGDGASGRVMQNMNEGTKLIIASKEHATAAAEEHMNTPDGFLDAKTKEADLALFKARLVKYNAESSGDQKALAESTDAETKILSQQKALDTLHEQFAQPGADKSKLLLAAYGSEYEAARRGSTASLLGDSKGITTDTKLTQQFNVAVEPAAQSTELIPEEKIEPLPAFSMPERTFTAAAATPSAPGGPS